MTHAEVQNAKLLATNVATFDKDPHVNLDHFRSLMLVMQVVSAIWRYCELPGDKYQPRTKS